MIPPKKKVKTIYIFNFQVSKLGNLKWKFKELMTNFTLTGKNIVIIRKLNNKYETEGCQPPFMAKMLQKF